MSLLPLSLSHSRKHFPIAQTRVLLLSAGIFDLFVQPIILAENWSNSSPVCDSFTPPTRILNDFVYLEYFAAVGD